MKKRAQAPKSSRKGCVADGPNARPAIRLRTSGTPQASATKIAALRPASSASSRSTPNRRCNSKNGPPCEARYSPIRLASSSSASTPMATSALPMTLVISPASSDANSSQESRSSSPDRHGRTTVAKQAALARLAEGPAPSWRGATGRRRTPVFRRAMTTKQSTPQCCRRRPSAAMAALAPAARLGICWRNGGSWRVSFGFPSGRGGALLSWVQIPFG